MIVSLLILQAAAVQLPDIAFHARVQARSLTIEKRGEAKLVVYSDPRGANQVEVQAPRAGGRKTIRNPEIQVNVEARITPPQAETGSPD